MDIKRNTTKIPEDINEKQRRRFYFEKNFPELLEEIDKFNEEYKIDNFSVLLYHYQNNLSKIIGCKICNKETKFISFIKGYNSYCSKKCVMSDKDIVEKRNTKSKKTNLSKYGVDNPMKFDEFKTKVKNTNLEKWGVENYTQTEEYKKEMISKNREKWGVDWYQQSDDFKKKSTVKYLERWGVEHHMKNSESVDNIKKINKEKWGVENYTQTQEYKKRMKEYYNSPDFKDNISKQKIKRKQKEIQYYSNYNRKYKLISIKNEILELNCTDCLKDFNINKQLYYLRNKNSQICCTICNKTDSKNISYMEKELLNFIKEVYVDEVIENYKDKYEIDVYLPGLNIGFEFNGLWYHSENFKNKTYHRDKSTFFKNKNINIINIWEDDWVYKKDILKSMIFYKINKIGSKIGARKCYIKLVDNDVCREFLNDNHLQGYVSSSIKIGLFYSNELVSLMTLGKSRNKSNEIEILRFCNKKNITIIGGFTRLLKYFFDNYNFEKLITYADISHSNGDLYLNNGFEFEKTTDVGYYWCKNGLKYNRFNFRKSKLIKQGYDSDKTEVEIMHERGYYRLYNCGNYKFIIKND